MLDEDDDADSEKGYFHDSVYHDLNHPKKSKSKE